MATEPAVFLSASSLHCANGNKETYSKLTLLTDLSDPFFRWFLQDVTELLFCRSDRFLVDKMNNNGNRFFILLSL